MKQDSIAGGGLVCSPEPISFSPLTRANFALLQKWLAAPHVSIWWNERFDLADIETKFGPRVDGKEPVYTYLIQHESLPIGWIQWYRWRDFPAHAAEIGAGLDSAGIDLAIGEVELTGRGLGPGVIREFRRDYIFTNAGVEAIFADPSAANLRSVRAFLKAGFEVVDTIQLSGEDFSRHIVRWPRPSDRPMLPDAR